MSDLKVPRMSVIGKGSVMATPDIGYVDLYVRAEGALLEDAMAEAKRKTDKIVDAIKGSVSEVKSVTVSDVKVGELKRSSRDSKESPKPEVIKNIFVVIPPVGDIAVKIVDMASRLGGSLQNPEAPLSAGQPQSAILYGLLNREGVEDSAIKKANDAVRKTAVRTGKILGKEIGRILDVTNVELSGTGDATVKIKTSLDSKYASDYLSVSRESVEVRVSLNVDFELIESGSRKISIKL